MGLFDAIRKALSTEPEPKQDLFQRVIAPVEEVVYEIPVERPVLDAPREPDPEVEMVLPPPVVPVCEEKRDRPAPSIASSLRKKPLMSEEDIARIRAKAIKQKERSERKKLKKQAKQAQIVASTVPDSPAPAPIVKSDVPPQLVGHRWKPGESGNPDGRPKTKYTREAIIKIIAEAAAVHKLDPKVSTRWQQLMRVLYDRALNPDIKTADLMLIMNFLSERMDGKPAADVDPNALTGGQALTINIGTRFTPAAPAEMPRIDVIDAEVVHGE